MKIAIIGAGISGLAAAYYLQRNHEVHVFEESDRIGGHTATVDVALGGRTYAVDTGFIVFNDWTYPGFIALMDKLGVTAKDTSMSFSFRDRTSGLEYAGGDLNTLFAQRKNLFSPKFLLMLRDILRFNKQAIDDLENGEVDSDIALCDYLEQKKYSDTFRNNYLIPMGAAIWSADIDVMLDFPLQFFLRFFRNHGLLSVNDRPQWRVIQGGSREYLGPLTSGFTDRIYTGASIAGLKRTQSGVYLTHRSGKSERFDHVVLACHSDQALTLLEDPSMAETEVLGAIPYQTNEVVLHTDVRLLPRNTKAWSSWNYLGTGSGKRATVTYNMNILQGIESPHTFCVTLNHTDAINPHRILGRFNYSHPIFTLEGMSAQKRWSEINTANTSYCGAYWGNGFHEDGVQSALKVAAAIASYTIDADRLDCVG